MSLGFVFTNEIIDLVRVWDVILSFFFIILFIGLLVQILQYYFFSQIYLYNQNFQLFETSNFNIYFFRISNF